MSSIFAVASNCCWTVGAAAAAVGAGAGVVVSVVTVVVVVVFAGAGVLGAGVVGAGVVSVTVGLGASVALALARDSASAAFIRASSASRCDRAASADSLASIRDKYFAGESSNSPVLYPPSRAISKFLRAAIQSPLRY